MYTFAYDEALQKKVLHKYTHIYTSYYEGVEVETVVIIKDNDVFFCR